MVSVRASVAPHGFEARDGLILVKPGRGARVSLSALPSGGAMKIKEICSRVVVVAEPETDLRAAARLMRDHHVGALVVIEKLAGATRPIGIVTDRDIVVAAVADAGVRPESLTLRDMMSGELTLAQESDGVFEAVDKMQDSGARRLPVVDAEGRLIGILSLDDVLRMLAGELTALALASQRSIAREARARPPLADRAA
jgi:CBS domain-containing protein